MQQNPTLGASSRSTEQKHKTEAVETLRRSDIDRNEIINEANGHNTADRHRSAEKANDLVTRQGRKWPMNLPVFIKV